MLAISSGLGAMLPEAKRLATMLRARGLLGGGDQSALRQADRPRHAWRSMRGSAGCW